MRNSSRFYLASLSAIAITLLLSRVLSPGASAVDVSMRIEILSYMASHKDPADIKTNQSEFSARCIVTKDRWVIYSEFTRNVTEVFYFDGTNVYRTWKLRAPRGGTNRMTAQIRDPQAPSTIETNVSFITVIPGSHPLGTIGVNLPWLAFCSSFYLDLTNRLIPLPGDSIRHAPTAFGYADKTERFQDSLALPRTVELYASKELMRQSPHRALLIRSVKSSQMRTPASDAAQSIRDGLLQCKFWVERSTNINELSIPLKFHMTQYRPSQEEVLDVRAVANGIVENIAMTSPPDSPIPTDGTNIVTDLRFRDDERLLDAITYRTVNSAIPPVSDPILQQRFKETQEAAPRDPAR